MRETSRRDLRSEEGIAYRGWHKTRRWQIKRREQLRSEPFCSMCLATGVYVLATVADHVEPHRGDPGKFWNGALQSLCKPHHDRDKQLIELGIPLVGVDEDGWPTDPRLLSNGGTGNLSRAFEDRRLPADLKPSAIPLTVVCGPPGSGKSSYVAERSKPDDVVIDLDEIIASLSGLPLYQASKAWLTAALDERNRRLRALHTDVDHRAAWFIVSAPDPGERQTWARRLGGDLVVLATDARECIRRIRADPARAGHRQRMERGVREWFEAAGPERSRRAGATKTGL
jgi:hypothetical protein